MAGLGTLALDCATDLDRLRRGADGDPTSVRELASALEALDMRADPMLCDDLHRVVLQCGHEPETVDDLAGLVAAKVATLREAAGGGPVGEGLVPFCLAIHRRALEGYQEGRYALMP